MFAFIDGKCQPAVYGGCYTNENRFYTLEECLSTCEGAPLEHECPAGRVAVAMCPECGPVGGCPEYGEHCAVTCGSDDDCKNTGFLCYEGICQVSLCE